jgi:hypothetical protein
VRANRSSASLSLSLSLRFAVVSPSIRLL